MSEQHMLWVERYRPRSIEDCVLPSKTKAVAQQFIDKGQMPNLLLSGPAGTGKTTMALALCDQLGYDTMMINGSNEGRLIDTLRTKIVDFASSVSFTGERKVVIIDEADQMPHDTVQAALRNFIEEYSANCGFILTCNFPNRMMDAIHSRTTQIDFTIPQDERAAIAKEMMGNVERILTTENIEYDKRVIAQLVKKHFPDFRKLINDLQRYSVVGKIDTGILSDATQDELNALIGFLKERDFNSVRKWVASAPNLEISTLSRALYNGMHDIVVQNSMPQLVIDLADYQYKDSFVADKEINIMAMLTTIMINSEFK